MSTGIPRDKLAARIGILAILLLGAAIMIWDHVQRTSQVVELQVHGYKLYQWQSMTKRVQVSNASGPIDIDIELTVINQSDREVVLSPIAYKLTDANGVDYFGETSGTRYYPSRVNWPELAPLESVYGSVRFKLDDPIFPITLTLNQYQCNPVVINMNDN